MTTPSSEPASSLLTGGAHPPSPVTTALDWEQLEPSPPSLMNLVLVGLLLVVAGAAAGVGFGQLSPTLYGARAEFVLYSSSADSSVVQDRAATQVSILSSQAVFAEVASRFKTDVTRLRERVQVDRAPEGGAVTLTVADRDRDRALGITQALVDRYGSTVSDTFSTDLVTQYLESEAERLSARRAQIESSLRKSPEDGSKMLRAQLSAVADQQSSVSDEIREIRSLQLETAAALHLVSRPYLLEEPVGPSDGRQAAIGALLGAAVAAGVVTAVVLLRRTRPGR